MIIEFAQTLVKQKFLYSNYYSSLVWAQNLNSIKRPFVLKKKSLRIIYCRSRNDHTSPLFRESNILNLPDKIALENNLLINKYFNKFLPTIFKSWFTLSSDSIPTILIGPIQVALLFLPITLNYTEETQSILVLYYTWDYLQKLNESNLFCQQSPSKLKIIIRSLFKTTATNSNSIEYYVCNVKQSSSRFSAIYSTYFKCLICNELFRS